MLIATAGHIDHGKTALVRAITGVETDRLPEERERGISIDLGFAYWRPDDGPTIGFVDVPGHERFLRNMIAGLSGIDRALLVIAADDGIMPQTIEHLRILDLLGVSLGLVAITKADKVDDGRIATLRGEIAALLGETGLQGASVLVTSAQTGSGIAELAGALKAMRDAARDDPDHHFRLSIDRFFTLSGSGTVVTGTVLAGHAAPGDALIVSPLGREVRLRSLQSGGRRVDRIGPGERCALNLTDIEVSELHRGDWIVAPEAHAPTARIDARLHLARDRKSALRHDSQVHLHIGAAFVGARVLVPRQRSLPPGGEELVQLVLDRPTLALTGQRFVLRDQSGRELVGGGRVLDPLCSERRRTRAESTARAAALTMTDRRAMIAALADAPGIEPDLGWFARCVNLKREGAERLCAEADLIRAGRSGQLAISTAKFARLTNALLAALAAHHRDHPDQAGMASRAVRSILGEPVSVDLLEWLLRQLQTEGRIEMQGAQVRLPGHAAQFSAVETDLWRKVIAAVDDRAGRAIVPNELARDLRVSEPVVIAMLQRRKASGALWQVTENRFLLREQVARLVALAARLDAGSTDGFTAAGFRDASGIGRNFIIHLLEFFDRIGVTRRQGDARRMRGGWQSVVGVSDDR